MTAPAEMRLIDPERRRLCFTSEERVAFIGATRRALRNVRMLCTVLHDAGRRISEALELIPVRIDLATGAIGILGLKKCRPCDPARRPAEHAAKVDGHAKIETAIYDSGHAAEEQGITVRMWA